MKLLVTGGTGFIGSHIVRAALSAGHEVLVLRREKSSLARCADFQTRVRWLNGDDPQWWQLAAMEKPAAIIHTAWTGVTAAERADWKLQSANLEFFTSLLQIAGRVKSLRFISLGSQAEYGRINGRVDESYPCRPDTAYGAAKLACLALLDGFARQYEMNHVWLRLFSVYGPGEGPQWFIPNLIRQMKLGQPPQLSGCEQRYDYLHVHDLAAGLLAVLQHPGKNGIYNFGSNASLPLKKIVQLVKEYSGCPVEPAFGALPYRPGQAMHLEGDSTRFNRDFDFKPKISITDGLRPLVAEAQ